jgi:hypothetical protein
MAGGPIKVGHVLRRSHVLDVFPTVLYLLGLPIPEDADGELLRDALDEGTLRRVPPGRIATYDDAGAAAAVVPVPRDPAADQREIEKLRALGYVR